jgi:hypothetical protein
MRASSGSPNGGFPKAHASANAASQGRRRTWDHAT